MAILVEMPKLSDTMVEGKIVSWIKKIGESVGPGEAIAEVETDKATMELEVFDEGVLLKILVEAGSGVPIGGPVAIIGDEGEDVEDMAKQAASGKSAAPKKEKQEKPIEEPKDESKKEPSKEETPSAIPAAIQAPLAGGTTKAGLAGTGKKIKASPVAQRMAAENNIDLFVVEGSGPGGRIVKRDIESYLEKPAAARSASAPAVHQPVSGIAYEDIELTSIRAAIARRLPESKGPVPHFYLEVDVDAEPLMNAKNSIKAVAQEKRITVTDLLIKACALALQKHPAINSSFNGDKIRRYYVCNIGIAVAGEDTLLVPVIKGCDAKTVSQIAQNRAALVENAQKGKVSGDDMSDGTFTISNLGMMGITRFSAIINPPQAAILAVGTTRDEPVVKDGQVVPGKRMSLTLSCDHRVFDGSQGAEFLQTLQAILENPISLCI